MSAAGRLLIAGVRGSRRGEALLESDLDACAEAGVGGVILFDVDVPSGSGRNVESPQQLAELVSYLRERLGEELWVSIDQEGGHVARLRDERGFVTGPPAAEFAALPPAAREEAARVQADQLAALGIDLNFAPCVDLATNPENPVIAARGRAYSADPERVVEAARVVLDAHRAAGVAACLKHFPGHGSSAGDSHLGMVDVTAVFDRDAELRPYLALGASPGVAVMVAHVVHRDLDPDWPASLSEAHIDGLLRGELGFEGVVITDSIDMRAVRDLCSAEEAAVLAVRAGADLVVDAFNLQARDEHPAPALARALAAALGSERIEKSLARIARLRAQIRGGTRG